MIFLLNELNISSILDIFLLVVKVKRIVRAEEKFTSYCKVGRVAQILEEREQITKLATSTLNEVGIMEIDIY